jgi:hypothetical protein
MPAELGHVHDEADGVGHVVEDVEQRRGGEGLRSGLLRSAGRRVGSSPEASVPRDAMRSRRTLQSSRTWAMDRSASDSKSQGACSPMTPNKPGESAAVLDRPRRTGLAASDGSEGARRPCKLRAGWQLANLAENGASGGEKRDSDGGLSFAIRRLWKNRKFIFFAAALEFIGRHSATSKCRMWFIVFKGRKC